MSFAVPVSLASLAVLDATFAGFRAAAGRDARIFKRAYYVRAVLLGAGSGVGLVVVLGIGTLGGVLAADDGQALYAGLLVVGGRMLQVFLAYALMVFATLALYATARPELRTLATVSILGPFTMLRPWVVIGATAWGLAGGASRAAVALTVASSGSVLLVGRLLDRWYGRHAGVARRGPARG